MSISKSGFKFESIREIDSWLAYDFEWIVRNHDKSSLYKMSKNTSDSSVPPVIEEKEYHEIVTFAFEDSEGNKGSFDIDEFRYTKEFLESIREKILGYKYCFAWGSKAVVIKNKKTGKLEGINGDLVVLDSNLKENRIPSIVNYNEFSGMPYIKKNIFTEKSRSFQADIDFLKVFAKPLVRQIFTNRYKSLHLDEVCKTLVGIGKLENKTGARLEEMSIEERKFYCLHDAHLVAELVRINNGDVLKIMQIIAFHTGLKFEEVCHKGMTGIWKTILNRTISKKIDTLGYANLHSVLKKLYSNKSGYWENDDNFSEDLLEEENNEYEDDEISEYKDNSYEHYAELLDHKKRETDLSSEYTFGNTNNNNLHKNEKNKIKIKKYNDKYKGGLIIPPIRELHSEVLVFDITSLYPTMIINNNISPETINCSCCKNDPKARLMFDDMFVNDFLHNKNNSGYWVCRRRAGLFSNKLKELTQIRIQYKKEGKILESTTIKAIINSGYGVFGHSNFKYYDPSVAELVTALGRQTLLGMQAIAKELNFKILYGDTDSLFVNGVNNNDDISNFINICKTKLNVDVIHEKTFQKLILVSSKHYLGFTSDKNQDPVIKGMEGIKSDRPEFIHTTFKEMVKDIQVDVNPIPKLKQALAYLDKRQVPKERLMISLTLAKNPQEYVNDCLQKRLGTKLGLSKGDILTHYKADKQVTIDDASGKPRTRTVGESNDPADISYAKYKEIFINAVKDIIEILGYSVEKDLLAKRKLS